MKGCVELNTVVKNVDPVTFNSFPQHPLGLARLCGIYVERYLPKDKSVRVSNWDGALNEEQMKCQFHP